MVIFGHNSKIVKAVGKYISVGSNNIVEFLGIIFWSQSCHLFGY